MYLTIILDLTDRKVVGWALSENMEAEATTVAARQEARLAIFEYIEGFYNRKRRHSALGYLAPCQYEEWLRQQSMAA